jgi:four helix bundle protein
MIFMERKFDLEDRLIEFANSCLDIAESLPNTFIGNHVSHQLCRSSTSPCLNYGEAQAAESPDDFIHKMKVCLKELKETFNCLKLIKKRQWSEREKLDAVLTENNELISIFVTSIKTARRNKESRVK